MQYVSWYQLSSHLCLAHNYNNNNNNENLIRAQKFIVAAIACVIAAASVPAP